jgi:uncharacterized protein YbjT (DUF2867 family)
MNVLVTGGTGTLGRHIVMMLRQSGHRARILSRQPRGHVDAVQGDLRTGAGLNRAIAGMDAIIHAASATTEPWRWRSTDVLGTRRLLAVARESDIRHVVYLSIVGIDRVDYPYFKTKLRGEGLVRENVVPWSILRATQLHNFMELLLNGFSRLPFMLAIPLNWQFQPVEVKEVARRAVEVVLGEPAGMLPDFGGPEVRDFRSIALSWLTARKDSRRLVNLSIPFKFSRQVGDGRLTCPDHNDGSVTFDQHLAERYPLS